MARRGSTICLPFDRPLHPELVADPAAYRAALDRLFLSAPELFPEAFAKGYWLEESRTSRKLGLRLRRVRRKATGESFTVRPSFARPYMAGLAPDASGPLFLRAFGVPSGALAVVCGRDHAYWYRVEAGLGRNTAAGTSLRRAAVPEHSLPPRAESVMQAYYHLVLREVGQPQGELLGRLGFPCRGPVVQRADGFLDEVRAAPE